MLTFSGFNGFHQFGDDHERKVRTPKELHVDIFGANKINLISSSWSYTAFACNRQLMLKGFLEKGPNTELRLTTDDVVKQISVCDRFCLILLENGKLFKLLPRFDAILQEVKFDLDDSPINRPPQKRSIFGESKTSNPLRISHVACGSNIAVALSSTNAVYSIPSKIFEFPKHFHVKQLQCGFEHALLLSSNGDIYSWGNGLRGQHGLDMLSIEECPVMIEALAGIKIVFIAAGGWHSAAISAFGDLYTWGFNSNGQLGLRLFKPTAEHVKQPSVYPLPQVIDLPKCDCCKQDDTVPEVEVDLDCKCVALKVFAGARHTIIQMSCGTILASGWNFHGQLGISEKVDLLDCFKMIGSQDKEGEIEIICGSWCTIMQKTKR